MTPTTTPIVVPLSPLEDEALAPLLCCWLRLVGCGVACDGEEPDEEPGADPEAVPGAGAGPGALRKFPPPDPPPPLPPAPGVGAGFGPDELPEEPPELDPPPVPGLDLAETVHIVPVGLAVAGLDLPLGMLAPDAETWNIDMVGRADGPALTGLLF